MGPNVELETENGDIRGNNAITVIYKINLIMVYKTVVQVFIILKFSVASSYSDQAKFSSNKGSMNLRNIHNESYVAIYEEGDVKIQGLDGSTNIFIKKVRHNANKNGIPLP